MSSPSGKTVDVIIGSPRPGFFETIQVILKGYYPYKLQSFTSVDEILELNNPEFKPILALIDGQDGTQKTVEWVQSTKMNYPECHLIVLHSAEADLDFTKVKKNGADEVMHISFDKEFISDMVLQLAPIEMDNDNIPITALMPVDLRDIEAGVEINFDVFVHLPGNHKTITLRKAGDSIDDRQVVKFKNLRQQMYVRKTQLKQFFEYARTIMSMRNIPFPISMTEKFHRSKRAIYEFMAEFLNNAATDYQEGKDIYEKCRSIIADLELNKDFSSDAEIFEEICRYSGNIRTFYHDCICIAAYSAYFAQYMGWTPEKREAVAIAGLLHNIGLSQVSAVIGDKPFAALTDQEFNEYKKYPERSVNLVKRKKVPISQEITDGIWQHRENVRGTGFPKAVQGKDFSEFGKLLSFAYRFHEMTALRDGAQAYSPQAALEYLRDQALNGEGEHDLLIATNVYKKLKSVA